MILYFFHIAEKCPRCQIEDCLVCWSKMITSVHFETVPRRELFELDLNLEDMPCSDEVVHDLDYE